MLPESDGRLAQVAEIFNAGAAEQSTETKPRRRLSVAGGSGAD
jgi:hypothetical protein